MCINFDFSDLRVKDKLEDPFKLIIKIVFRVRSFSGLKTSSVVRTV